MARRREAASQLHGLLVLNKPSGPTSARCLEMIKRDLGQPKIGHAGTLDPLASGVLLVLLGKATKLAQYLLEGGKTYSGRLRLGVTTDTYDVEGEVTAEADWSRVSPEQAADEVRAWAGLTEQTVPPYSAAKHEGKPLYRLSREGLETPVKTKAIQISHAEVRKVDLPWVDFRVSCGAGTYVRSLVHSLGMRLECGAILTELIRESSHPFSLDQAHDLDDVLNEPHAFAERVLPLAEALPHWPRVTLTPAEAALVRNGARLPLATGAGAGDVPSASGLRAVFVEDREQGPAPIALVEARLEDGGPVWAILRGI
ncbi:MAG: tRNA pseudouridine(55) synthase TruB [Desulfovibrionaceae bacterium]|nr:tRNA pseudouridine(55) synthase TruB [Desulfovibrionaceae bacterium]